MGAVPQIESVEVDVFRVPTVAQESDGTLDWDATTVVTTHVRAGGAAGLGWTYASRAAAVLIDDVLDKSVVVMSSFDIERAHDAMSRSLSNV
jgi:hypothetical protein